MRTILSLLLLTCSVAVAQTIKSAAISFTTAGAEDKVVIAPQSGTYYEITGWVLSSSAGISITLKSGATGLTGAMAISANVPVGWSSTDHFWTTGLGAPFVITASGAATVGGTVWYREQTADVTAYYVDVDAPATIDSIANTGESAGVPFNAIADINALTLAPGTTVYFEKGDTFPGALVVPTSGTAASPITFTAYGSGAAPILDAATTGADCVAGTSMDYIVLDGLHLKNGETNGVTITSGSYWTVTGCTIDTFDTYGVSCLTGATDGFHEIVSCTITSDSTSTGDNGVNVATQQSVVIENCTIVRTGAGAVDAVNFASAGGRNHVTGCTITGPWDSDVYASGSTVTVRETFMHGSTLHALRIDSGGSMTAINCAMNATGATTAGVGVAVQGAGASFAGYFCTFVNSNTDATGYATIRVDNATGSATVESCLFEETSNGLHWSLAASATATANNNLYFPDTSAHFVDSVSATDLAGWQTKSYDGAASITGDPLLVDNTGTTAVDYKLGDSSPGIDAGSGAAASRLGIVVDLFGGARRLGAGVDIGAHEKE